MVVMTELSIKTRFAPSPTGYLHLGNVRTALFNALLARKHDGVFLLRIEDTDRERSRDEYTQALLEDLHWLDLHWQEGPSVGGAHGPYAQSDRETVYQHYYQVLEQQGQVYPCFCSPTELALARKAQLAAGQPPRYPGTCAQLTATERQARWARGLQPTLRFRVPPGRAVEFNDLVRGPQRFNTADIGDFIIRRADGGAQFFFTNAVDDALMGVTHVLRGEDHLTNTPRQLLLLEVLGLPAPEYGHIAMIVGADSSPLSKRHGSRSLRELRKAGFLPEALNNYLARLGHTYEHDTWMTLAELAAGFTVERLGRAPARYDEAQLSHWQSAAVVRADPDRLWVWMGTAVREQVPADKRGDFIDAVRPNIRFPPDARDWAERFFESELALDETAHAIITAAGAGFFQQALAAYAEQGAAYKPLIEQLKASTGTRGKALFMPLRVALTGVSHGPELARILALMPAAIIRRRLQACC
jgi:nondiscriminating glutamyl-tRNA synthetase